MRDKIEFTPDYGTKENSAIIKVIGVGGGGGNAVRHMYSDGIVGVDFLICNTDYQALKNNAVPSKLVLGESGLGAGAKPEVARDLALDSHDSIVDFIGTETRMLFITAGMGKGTGTGAAPVIAQIAKEMNILTIGVVTYPFDFEGAVRKKHADAGINEMNKYVDSLIVVKNQNIIKYYNDEDIDAAFGYADDVLKNAVKCIAELITMNAEQNIDFNDIESVMKDSGPAMLGLATAKGENRAKEVVESALLCPLLNEEVITNAKNFLFFVSYGKECKLKISELQVLTDLFNNLKNKNSDVIWGRSVDESLGEYLKLSVIITNYNVEEKPTENHIDLDEEKEEQGTSITVENEVRTQNLLEDDYRNILNKQTTAPAEDRQANQHQINNFDFLDKARRDKMEKQEPVNSNRTYSTDNVFSYEPAAMVESAVSSGAERHPQMVRNDFDPRYENNDSFGDLINIPAIVRQRRDNQVDLHEKEINNQPHLDTEDDMHIFFKDIPD